MSLISRFFYVLAFILVTYSSHATIAFSDDFERTSLGSDWSTTNSSLSGTSTAKSNSGSLSMFTANGLVTVTSKAIDLSSSLSANLSFWVGVDGIFGGVPNSGEDLKVEILLASGNWQKIEQYTSSLFDFGATYNYNAALPENALHSDFQIRFTMLGGGVNIFDFLGDYWYIDDVVVSHTVYIPPPVDHFQFSYSSNALTCIDQTITLAACENAACSSVYTGSVTANLTSIGWVGGDSVTFSGGSTKLLLRNRINSTLNLAVSSSTPAVIIGSANTCRVDGGIASPNCLLTFADAGFIFDVPDMIAAKGKTNIALKAVKKSDATQACIPAFSSVSKTLSFWSDYLSPNATGRPVSYPVSVEGGLVGTSAGSATAKSVAFDAFGIATIAVNYSDAGQMQLNASYSGSGSEAGLLMTGSDQFISRPVGFCVSATATCSAGDATCPAFISAGTAFPLSVRAVAWQSDGDTDFCAGNNGTPNYTANSLGLSAAILAPSPANAAGSISPVTYNHSATVDGIQAIPVTQSEVGVFRFDVTPPSYFGYNLGTFSSAPIGRFYPDHFAVSVSDDGSLAANCSTSTPFSYSGEEITWLVAPQLTITAKNSANVTTQNYTTSGYLKLLVDDIDVANVTADSSAVDSGAVPLSITSIFNTGTLNTTSFGELTYDFSPLDLFTYTREVRAEINSFTPDILMSVTDISDSDGVAMSSSPLTFTPLANMDVRFGRLWLEDTYGPETLDVVMPLRAEYFDGARYRVNIADSCTAYSSVNASVSPVTLTQVDTGSGVLNNGVSGTAGLLLLAPTSVAGMPDTGDATVTYTTPSWLQGDYDNNASFEDARGTVSFGLYRGHDRVIYRKEIR